MFTDIRYKAKQFAHRNAQNKKIDGLKFRRLKFYDMILSILFFIIIGTMPVKNAFAKNGSTWSEQDSKRLEIAGNDPTFTEYLRMASNDPTLTGPFIGPILKDHFKMDAQTEESEKLVLALAKECEEFINSEDSPSTWDQDCLEIVTQWVMYECMNDNERACSKLRSEDLIVEI